ncbi:hypothetical protein SAMN02787078_03798, partial [Lysinibacillus sp. SG9]
AAKEAVKVYKSLDKMEPLNISKDMSKKEKFLRTGFNMGLQQTQKSKGKFDATVDVAKNTYNDVKKLVTDPIGVVKETTDSLKNFASDPLVAVKTIGGSIEDSFEKDVIHGNDYSRAYWGTKATLNTATAVVGTKGVGTLTKVGKTSTGVTSVKSTTSSSSSKGTGNSRLPDHMLGKNDADPFRDIYGPGRLSHPEEWESIIKKTKEAGVEVRILDRDIMAYAPKGNGPGQLNIYENASISALRHEYQHFLDDMSKGYPKLEVTYEFKNRIIMELRAYMVEIKEAERIGNKALAEQLWNNYREERQYLIDAFGPINE